MIIITIRFNIIASFCLLWQLIGALSSHFTVILSTWAKINVTVEKGQQAALLEPGVGLQRCLETFFDTLAANC